MLAFRVVAGTLFLHCARTALQGFCPQPHCTAKFFLSTALCPHCTANFKHKSKYPHANFKHTIARCPHGAVNLIKKLRGAHAVPTRRRGARPRAAVYAARLTSLLAFRQMSQKKY